MIFSPTWLSDWLMILAWVGYVPCVVWAVFRQRDWHIKRMVVAMLAMAFLWAMGISLEGGDLAGMSYHLLGLNLVALMMGAPTAFLLGSAWVLATGLAKYSFDFVNVFALNAWGVVVPACVLNVVARRLALAKLPRHIFVYIFVNGFLTSAMGMLLTGAVVWGFLWGGGVFAGDVAWLAVFPVFLLLAWGEAFLTGIAVAICVSFRPHLLATFDDAIYLNKPNRIWRT